MECISKRQLLARASILIKKDFTNLGQNDLRKKSILMITMFILYVRGFHPLGRLTARIATLALGFDPKGIKPSDIQYNINIVIIR